MPEVVLEIPRARPRVCDRCLRFGRLDRIPPRVRRCPICGKEMVPGDAYPERPFCSDRCKLIDLGKWIGEQYRVPVAQREDEERTLDREPREGEEEEEGA